MSRILAYCVLVCGSIFGSVTMMAAPTDAQPRRCLENSLNMQSDTVRQFNKNLTKIKKTMEKKLKKHAVVWVVGMEGTLLPHGSSLETAELYMQLYESLSNFIRTLRKGSQSFFLVYYTPETFDEANSMILDWHIPSPDVWITDELRSLRPGRTLIERFEEDYPYKPKETTLPNTESCPLATHIRYVLSYFNSWSELSTKTLYWYGFGGSHADIPILDNPSLDRELKSACAGKKSGRKAIKHGGSVIAFESGLSNNLSKFITGSKKKFALAPSLGVSGLMQAYLTLLKR